MSVIRLRNARRVSAAGIIAAGLNYPIDVDAERYLAAVEAADGQSLETAVRIAVSQFVVGCKAAGIWSAIKASCLLMGARTLSGALSPLVGTAPTNNNFVSGDYNRRTGLIGDGATKWLNTNRNNNADPQNNQHAAVYVSAVATSAASGPTTAPCYIGTGGASIGAMNIGRQPSNSLACYVRNRNGSAQGPGGATSVGFFGASRTAGGSYVFRASGSSSTQTIASETPYDGSVGVFRSGVEETTITYVNGRIAYYSVGEGANLASLDSHVSALYAAIGAAI